MCSFFSSTGCYHGLSCDFAHDVSELQPAPDLRKSTICINFARGYAQIDSTYIFSRRCSLSDCRFAHGPDELRPRPAIPEHTVKINSVGSCASPSETSNCPLEASGTSREFPKLERTRLSLDDAISTTVISVDEALGGDGVERQRLDLFDCLDFGDEQADNENCSDCDSILSTLSREMQNLDFVDEEGSRPTNVGEGDHSPWSLPR